ncbi:hypothetical protein ACHMW6_02860 [Pseudoduganella sp. UC29_106]|uniref:hypothetical protein n=1 Tax=Pseudoduganella sp. UC29_106 TaxID=3374553 RepID=UPI0037575F20
MTSFVPTLSRAALALSAAALLSACGGSGGSSAPIEPAAPPPMTDAFTVTVLSLIASAPDDTEPSDAADTVALTTPDDREPSPVD